MPTVPTIRLSEDAPAEAVHFTFFGGEFDLGGSGRKTYETDDEVVLGNASAHPWLVVERPEVKVTESPFFDQLAPADDHLSAIGGINANDPAEIAKSENAKLEAAGQPVALDAGLTQTDPVVSSNVAETLAADETSKTFDKTDKDS